LEIFIFAIRITAIEDPENQVLLNESRAGDSRHATLSTCVEESFRNIEA